MSLSRTVSERNYTYDHEKYDHDQLSGSANGIYKSAAVACDSTGASSVGKKILEQGGSAVDAAIASLLCNGILNAHSMGIGGGFFMLHYDRKEEKVSVIDARETAPSRSTVDMFKSISKTKGGLSIAVPSEIKGYWKAHQMFGQMKWNKLFQPAIEMCNNGFQLPSSQAKFIKYCEAKIMSCKAMRETYFNKMSNDLYKTGNLLKRPKLAKTLEIIAKEGETAFYNGCLTDIIVDEIQTNGGIVTKADLQSYECVIKEPVTYTLKNKIELNSVPGPSCGALLNFILAILDEFEFEEFTLDSTDSTTLFYHRFLEASKFAFGQRHLIGDENFNHLNDIYKMLSSAEIISEYRHRINSSRTYPQSFYGSTQFVTDNGTSHTSLVAPDGNAVAVTSSINLVFGSKVMGDKTNIIYNNQMDDFSSPNSEYNSFALPNFSINYIEPGKRPVSSMAPLIALDQDKNIRLVAGSSGGTRIITSTAMTCAQSLLHKRSILNSIDEARLHHQLFPHEVLHEDSLEPDVLCGLSQLGHKLVNFGRGGSAVQAIERLEDGRLLAVSDKRKGGAPSGF